MSNIPASPVPVHSLDIPERECGGALHRQLKNTQHLRLQNTGGPVQNQKFQLWEQHNIPQNQTDLLPLSKCYTGSRATTCPAVRQKIQKHPRSSKARGACRPTPSPPNHEHLQGRMKLSKGLFTPEAMDMGLTEKIHFFTTILWSWRLMKAVRRGLGSIGVTFSQCICFV